MKQYLNNLFLALTGSSPFREELEEAKRQLEKATCSMSALQDQYCTALEKWDDCQQELEQTRATLRSAEKLNDGSQALIENLRERIREKDAEMKQQGVEFRERMERIKQDYQKRIDEYNIIIEEMQSFLPQRR